MTEVLGPDQLIGNANGNKERNATREVTKYNLVTRRHIKMSRQGAGAVTMAVTKADPSPATALSLPRISPF